MKIYFLEFNQLTHIPGRVNGVLTVFDERKDSISGRRPFCVRAGVEVKNETDGKAVWDKGTIRRDIFYVD